jgi:hypothetical protein
MDTSYWLGRKRASVANANAAESAEARLIHLDLAGRYSIKAAMARQGAAAPAEAVVALRMPAADRSYYERLEIGARWVAAGAPAGERDTHLAMADRYARLGRVSTGEGR